MTDTLVGECQPVTGGGILYDPLRVSKPNAALFDEDAWRVRAGASSVAGGRGQVLFIHHGAQRWVLRHYRRGGLIANLSRDRYFWTGAERTRSFREWRLLAEMREAHLPVPAPIAARYECRGLFYRADLITEEISGARTLSQIITTESLGDGWQDVGATIARFHRHGVRHADLNAHNILIANDEIYLIDFDRGKRLQHGSWQRQVLARLHRSLDKLKGQDSTLHFAACDWLALLKGYDEEMLRG